VTKDIDDNINQYSDILGILDSLENRCVLLRLIIPMIERQPELERCTFTLLEDNHRTTQVLVDSFCTIEAD